MQQLNIWMRDLMEQEDKSASAAVHCIIIKELFKLKQQVEGKTND